MPTKIMALEGKVLKIIIAPLDVYFYIHFNLSQMELLDEYAEPVDTTIHSNPLGLIRLSLLPASKARSLFNDKIRLSGDVETGQQVKQLFDELDIDWEGHLAHFTGDVVAHQIGSLFHKARGFTAQFGESMRLNTKDYLQEELRVLPTQAELNDFFQDIDTLSLRVERLQARMALIGGLDKTA
jgi:ubiquinone biosynthesis protein UbiJ